MWVCVQWREGLHTDFCQVLEEYNMFNSWSLRKLASTAFWLVIISFKVPKEIICNHLADSLALHSVYS